MMTLASYDRAVKAARDAAPAAVAVPFAPIVELRVPALEWAKAILGKYAAVADDRQTAHARYLLCDEELASIKITPVGPSFADLDARLAQLDADQAAEDEASAEVAADMVEAFGEPITSHVSPSDFAPVATLTIEIKGRSYGLRPIPAGEFGTLAFRLTKAPKGLDVGGEVYDVLQAPHGCECSCPDWIFKRSDDGTACKHIAGLRAVGLLEAHPQLPHNCAEVTAEAAPEVRPEVVPAGDPLTDGEGTPAPMTLIDAEGQTEDVVSTDTLPGDGASTPCCPDHEAEPCQECMPAKGRRFGEGIFDDEEYEGLNNRLTPSHGFADELIKAIAYDDEVAGLVPVRLSPLPDGRYDLVGLIQGQAAYLRGQGSAPFTLMADALTELTAKIDYVGARSVADAISRLDVEDRERDDRLRDEGYALGVEAGRAQCYCC